MALINCPECSKEISDTVKKCPNCGFKIKKNMDNKHKLILLTIIGVIIGVLVGICFWGKPYFSYIRGMRLLENKEYEEAIEVFEKLSGYRDADDKIKEAKIKYIEENPATLSGVISYKYNNFVGNRGDTGAYIVAINIDIHEPDKYKSEEDNYGVNGRYTVKADMNGNYKLTDLPYGNYFVFVNSRNCRGTSFSNTTELLEEFSERELINLKTMNLLGEAVCFEDIYLKPNENKEISYDFGISLF